MPTARVVPILVCLITEHRFRRMCTPIYPPGDICGCKWRSGGHWDQLLSMFDRFWESPGLLGVICAPVGALVVIFSPLDRLWKGLGPTFERHLVEK